MNTSCESIIGVHRNGATSFLAWLNLRTADLIEAAWDSVEALAGALLEHRTLDARAAKAAMDAPITEALASRAARIPTRWAVGDADDQPRSELDPDGEARHREIITAYDAWRAERKVVEDAVGLTAATIADDEAGRALTAAEDAVEACRARTLLGLAAKAAWVADRLDSDVMETTLAPSFIREVAAFGQVTS